LAGNAYCGIGVPACIQSGQEAAHRILARFDTSTCAKERARCAVRRATAES
jgi:hypothetical protein